MRVQIKDKLIIIGFGFLITTLIVYLQISKVPFITTFTERLNYLAYDLRLNSTLKWLNYKPAPVVIVDIDEQSLQDIGRWPWPRRTIGALTSKLFEQGAVVVSFDVLFTEPQLNYAQQVFNYLKQAEDPLKLKQLPFNQQNVIDAFDDDLAFSKTFKHGDVVLGYVLHNEKSKPVGQLPVPLMMLDDNISKKLTIATASNYTANIPILQNSAYSAGFTTSSRDKDGTIRRAPLVMRYGDKLFASLALETARVYLLSEKAQIKMSQYGKLIAPDAVSLDGAEIEVDARGTVLVPFRGKRESFPYIPAVSVLNGTVNPDDLAGKIVLIGTSALGLADLQSTVVQSVYPGVEVHANVIAGILEQRFPVRPAWAPGANLFLLVLSGAIFSILFSFLGPISIILIGLLAISFEVGVNLWFWIAQDLALDIVYPVLLALSLIAFNISYGFLTENRRKQQIKDMFGQYVSTDHVDEMSDDPKHYTFEGMSKELTVLFADIRGFTTLSETLSASQLKSLLNDYFEPMTEIIFNYKGTVDKYVGDMIMAFWGAPKDDPEQASHAVQAALDMLDKTTILCRQFIAAGLPKIQIGIGLNTGLMNVGDMGSKYRRAYTVLGDAVNLGSRLEASTKFYGVRLIVGPTTKAQAKDFIYRQLDFVKVKGKHEPVSIYQPVCHRDTAQPELISEISLHHEALEAYRHQNWVEAQKIYQELLQKNISVQIYQMYLDRILFYQKNPPGEDWDGSFERTEK